MHARLRAASHMGNIPPVKMDTTGINRVPFGVRKVDAAEEADRKNQQVLNQTPTP